MNDINRELDWNDTIEKESDFVLLPEGDYDFTVESFERARYDGGQYTPPCPMAILKLVVETPEGKAMINHNLYLHSSKEGQLSAFFMAIGQKKKGEPLRMNWNMVPGSTGRAQIIQKPSSKDPTKIFNNVKKFYPKEAMKFEAGRF